VSGGDLLFAPLRVELDIFDDGSGAHTSLYWMIGFPPFCDTWTSPS
jgi:hypothetical protein